MGFVCLVEIGPVGGFAARWILAVLKERIRKMWTMAWARERRGSSRRMPRNDKKVKYVHAYWVSLLFHRPLGEPDRSEEDLDTRSSKFIHVIDNGSLLDVEIAGLTCAS